VKAAVTKSKGWIKERKNEYYFKKAKEEMTADTLSGGGKTVN